MIHFLQTFTAYQWCMDRLWKDVYHYWFCSGSPYPPSFKFMFPIDIFICYPGSIWWSLLLILFPASGRVLIASSSSVYAYFCIAWVFCSFLINSISSISIYITSASFCLMIFSSSIILRWTSSRAASCFCLRYSSTLAF